MSRLSAAVASQRPRPAGTTCRAVACSSASRSRAAHSATPRRTAARRAPAARAAPSAPTPTRSHGGSTRGRRRAARRPRSRRSTTSPSCGRCRPSCTTRFPNTSTCSSYSSASGSVVTSERSTVLPRRRPGQHVADAVPVEHRRPVLVRRAVDDVGSAGSLTWPPSDRGSTGDASRLLTRSRASTSHVSQSSMSSGSTRRARTARRSRARRSSVAPHRRRRPSRARPPPPPAVRARRRGTRVPFGGEQQVQRGRDVDLAAVATAVGDEALVRRQQELDEAAGRERVGASTRRHGRVAERLATPLIPSISPKTRSSRRPISPKRHAGPWTTLSFHNPTNEARSISTPSIERDVDERRVVGQREGERRAGLGEPRQHPAGGHREELADRRHLGQKRAELTDERIAAPDRRRLGLVADGAGRPAISLSIERRRTHPSPSISPVRSSTTRSARAISSLRSTARPAQNNASAARVGTDAIRSTCGSGARRRTTGATAPPTTHRSFAVAAVGTPDRRRRRARARSPGQHLDAEVAGDRLQPQDDAALDDLRAVEARPAPQRLGARSSGAARSGPSARRSGVRATLPRPPSSPRAPGPRSRPQPWALASRRLRTAPRAGPGMPA